MYNNNVILGSMMAASTKTLQFISVTVSLKLSSNLVIQTLMLYLAE